ncbi:hypothetical protein NQ315_009352 [Exocentrus adspersus]|uniref:Chitin-binding type-2 domain-containing protein n=1 Tax=Exocentrus adspersus TaxID=1586481 RepID=A0AAV8WGE9_9CUCU|nr:hypothetical protein NQ315_009352 [Exocentrus adspersus]
MMHLFTFLTVILSVVLLTLAKVECPTNDGEDAVYLPHETECGKFYECAARTPVLLECPAGTYFDVRLRCRLWKPGDINRTAPNNTNRTNGTGDNTNGTPDNTIGTTPFNNRRGVILIRIYLGVCHFRKVFKNSLVHYDSFTFNKESLNLQEMK